MTIITTIPTPFTIDHSDYLAFLRKLKKAPSNEFVDCVREMRLEIPSYDFGDFTDYEDQMPDEMVCYHPTSDMAVLFRIEGHPYIVIYNVDDYEITAFVTERLATGWAVTTDKKVNDSIQEVAMILHTLLVNRTINYIETESSSSDLTRMNVARAKRGKLPMPTPKIIYLNKTVAVASTSRAPSGHKRGPISVGYTVPDFTRHYKRPIKSGPNKGKTEVTVRGHARGIYLPKSAKAMQYRVVA
jgi:hypothetical protein